MYPAIHLYACTHIHICTHIYMHAHAYTHALTMEDFQVAETEIVLLGSLKAKTVLYAFLCHERHSVSI